MRPPLCPPLCPPALVSALVQPPLCPPFRPPARACEVRLARVSVSTEPTHVRVRVRVSVRACARARLVDDLARAAAQVEQPQLQQTNKTARPGLDDKKPTTKQTKRLANKTTNQTQKRPAGPTALSRPILSCGGPDRRNEEAAAGSKDTSSDAAPMGFTPS